jgi:hypothetical protein
LIDWAGDFVENDDLFLPVPYTPVGGSTRDVRLLFEIPDFNPILAGGLKAESAQPKVTCATADISDDVTHGATFEINGKNYFVVHISDDGTGLTDCDLSETPDGG